MKRDLRVQWQLFLGVAVFIGVIDLVYWFVSYERAGTTMLTLAAGLAALFGGWLYVQDHRRPKPSESAPTSCWPVPEAEHEGEEHYLPAMSWWPLVIGVGLVLTLNGLILSWQFAVPGAVLMVLGIGGFVSDSRRRA
jgi:Cytochrome c oxidase subunit IV